MFTIVIVVGTVLVVVIIVLLRERSRKRFQGMFSKFSHTEELTLVATESAHNAVFNDAGTGWLWLSLYHLLVCRFINSFLCIAVLHELFAEFSF